MSIFMITFNNNFKKINLLYIFNKFILFEILLHVKKLEDLRYSKINQINLNYNMVM
jgi:hypothetical protein